MAVLIILAMIIQFVPSVNVYTVYQQLLIHRIQSKLSDQVEALGKMEVRTEEVYKLAVLDPLTGLNNRRSGEQRLAEEILRAQRHGRPLTILLLDFNGLKSLNDEFGHAAGDELIRQFAARLSKAIRGSDLSVRLGGDEFLVLLPECRPQVAAPPETSTPKLHGAKIRSKRVRMEGWRQRRPGSEEPTESEERKKQT